MIASAEIPHIVSGLRQSPQATRIAVAADLMARAGNKLNIGYGDTEEAISHAVGILANGMANRRDNAAANVLALCAKVVEAGEFPDEAIAQLGYLLGDVIGFDDEAQRTRSRKRRNREPLLKQAFNLIAAANPDQNWKGIYRLLEVGCTLPKGEFVQIQPDTEKSNFIIPMVDGKRLKAISEKTFMQYRERKLETANDGLVDG